MESGVGKAFQKVSYKRKKSAAKNDTQPEVFVILHLNIVLIHLWIHNDFFERPVFPNLDEFLREKNFGREGGHFWLLQIFSFEEMSEGAEEGGGS